MTKDLCIVCGLPMLVTEPTVAPVCASCEFVLVSKANSPTSTVRKYVGPRFTITIEEKP